MNTNSKIINDIKILESAGKFESAKILKNKLIKEAQYIMGHPMVYPQMQMMPQMLVPQTPMVATQAFAQPTVPVARPVANPTVTPATMPVAQPRTTPVQQIGQGNSTVSPAPSPGTQTNPPANTQTNPPRENIGPPPPMPIDKIQRQYGDGASKNQELQYLQKEKQRLEDLGYNDSKSPFYQQYLTIIGMINRNMGGSIIKKSKNFNKFEKLAILNAEIELLENAGKFKAAEILQKKFMKEAKSLNPNRDSGPYKQVFNKYIAIANTSPSQNLINTIRADGFLLREDQDQLVDYINLKLQTSAPPATPAIQPTATPSADSQPKSEVAPLANMTPTQVQPVVNNNNSVDPYGKQETSEFEQLLNAAKLYLSTNDFNNAAIIRDQAANSNMTPDQKNAWQQQYNNLIQNYSGTAEISQYDVQQQAQSNIYNAFIQLGAKPEQVIPQYIAANEQNIRQKLQQMNKLDPATEQLLRQISLSAYYIYKYKQ